MYFRYRKDTVEAEKLKMTRIMKIRLLSKDKLNRILYLSLERKSLTGDNKET